MPRTLAHDAAAGQNPPIQDRILAQILKPLHEFPENKPQISPLRSPGFPVEAGGVDQHYAVSHGGEKRLRFRKQGGKDD
jgi:hypothetical protein